ncbi:type II toxin-antitoxin system Phd/YefM family antitoxin [Glycomyces arizonensis]|uniref:type II toxin-antitoxin system Phd/YefM family antitoxin n=1 Tax=Glycomyces arizonensis TaxID=256035 RepID=UPI00055946BB|nr:hypothetical protein [Glycomyces arizonensis]
MAILHEHAIGMRELRHNTNEVLSRVRGGETLDVTEYGRTIARLVPVPACELMPVLDRLESAGRLRRASRPAFRPRMREGDGANQLSGTLADMRETEAW